MSQKPANGRVTQSSSLSAKDAMHRSRHAEAGKSNEYELSVLSSLPRPSFTMHRSPPVAD